MGIVKYVRKPGSPLSRRVKENLKAIAEIPDEQIDTSDIPELTAADFARAIPNPYYRPVKKAINARLDADVLAWLQSKGKGYQTRMNELLRQAMMHEIQSLPRAAVKKRA
jgi:uncharacterized protein (DUF4415 family)